MNSTPMATFVRRGAIGIAPPGLSTTPWVSSVYPQRQANVHYRNRNLFSPNNSLNSCNSHPLHHSHRLYTCRNFTYESRSRRRWLYSSAAEPPAKLNGETTAWNTREDDSKLYTDPENVQSQNQPQMQKGQEQQEQQYKQYKQYDPRSQDDPRNQTFESTHPNPTNQRRELYRTEPSSVGTTVGFNIHDGPVPINQTARAKARMAKKNRNAHAKHSDNATNSANAANSTNSANESSHLHTNHPNSTNSAKTYGSLMDPFYTPHTTHQTHLLQGGTPYDPKPPPYRLALYGEQSLHTLILLRHGESEWNVQNRYTGWCDVNLTKRGESEARAAGRLLWENGIEVDHAFTSLLKRASFTTNMCLNMARQHWVPITKTWRLNERHYGALQGYNKDTAYQTLNIDQELVMEMRRSYATRPPPMEDAHPYWHGGERRYGKLSGEQLERTRAESLKDAAERIMPFFNSVIVPSLREGNRCLVVSHANTIRTLIKQIDNISDSDIKQLSIPTGIPLIYRLDNDMKPVDPNCELEFRYLVQPKGYTWATSRQHGFHGVYLGDLERLQDIQRKRDATSRSWQRMILRKVAKHLLREEAEGSGGEGVLTLEGDIMTDHGHSSISQIPNSSSSSSSSSSSQILKTQDLWCKLTHKMQNPEFNNMLLLVRMREYLESILAKAHQGGIQHQIGKSHKYIPLEAYEKIVEKIHLDSEGRAVDPFVSLEDRVDREERQRRWIENLSMEDLEEECLIK